MLNEAKSLILPASLAYAGIKVSTMLGLKETWQQVAAGVAFAGAGLWVARKFKAA